MCSAANQVDLIEIFEAIVWPEIQHLAQIMRQIECCAVVNMVLMLPIRRSDHQFRADAFFGILDTNLLKLVEDLLSKRRRLAVPIDVGMHVRNRRQHVHSAVAGGCERGVGHTGILHVHRRVIR